MKVQWMKWWCDISDVQGRNDGIEESDVVMVLKEQIMISFLDFEWLVMVFSELWWFVMVYGGCCAEMMVVNGVLK